MPLRYLLDEHFRGSFWDIIQRHNLQHADPLNAARVGDLVELPLGTKDPEILLWIEREDRILISADKASMARHLAAHLASGHRCPGIMTPRPGVSLPRLLEFLILAAYASEPSEWADRITFIP